MILEGAKIYEEGIEIKPETEEKLRQVVHAIKDYSSASEVSMKVLRSGRLYECLLWGKINDVPIGVYNRGPSMNHVLDSVGKKVRRECLKAVKQTVRKSSGKEKTEFYDLPTVAMAS